MTARIDFYSSLCLYLHTKCNYSIYGQYIHVHVISSQITGNGYAWEVSKACLSYIILTIMYMVQRCSRLD